MKLSNEEHEIPNPNLDQHDHAELRITCLAFSQRLLKTVRPHVEFVFMWVGHCVLSVGIPLSHSTPSPQLPWRRHSFIFTWGSSHRNGGRHHCLSLMRWQQYWSSAIPSSLVLAPRLPALTAAAAAADTSPLLVLASFTNAVPRSHSEATVYTNADTSSRLHAESRWGKAFISTINFFLPFYQLHNMVVCG